MRTPSPATTSRAATWALALALAVYLLTVVRTAWVADDAFITLRTLSNAFAGYGLRWNVAERVQAFTHPLWLGVLSLPFAATGNPFASAWVTGLLVSLSGVILLARSLRGDPAAAALAVGLLTLSKAYVDFSTSGLENPLTHLLIFGFALVALGKGLDAPGGLAAGTAIASALALSRPDAVLLLLPALFLTLWRRRRVRDLASVALGASPWLSWETFSLVYYGALVPNTALAKLGSGIPRSELVRQGAAYLADSLRHDPITLAAIAAAVGVVAARGREMSRALAAGIALHLCFVVWIGGDFMSGRFLTPALSLSVVLLAPEVKAASPSVRWGAAAAIALLGLPFSGATILSGPHYGDRAAVAVAPSGIADEREFYFAYSGVWNGAVEPARPTTSLSFVRAGLDLEAVHASVATLNAIGFAGFIAGPGTHVVDTLALADPLLARLPMVLRAPPPYAGKDSGWRIGHFLRVVPPGYLATVATGSSRLADPAIAALWSDVALATRAPLMAPGRAAAIVRLVIGRSGSFSRPRYEPPEWDELISVRPDDLEARYRSAVAHEGTDPAGARAALESVVARVPAHGGATLELARMNLGDHRVDDAAVLVERYLALRPGDTAAMVLRAEIARARGRLPDAEAAYLEAGRRAPHLIPSAWTNAAIVRELRGDREGAKRLIDEVLAIQPAYEPALRTRRAIEAPR